MVFEHFKQGELYNNVNIFVYHNRDLDGLSSAIVDKYYDNLIQDGFNKRRVYFGFDYGEIFPYESFKDCFIIFCDVTLTIDGYQMLSNNGNEISVYDHHIKSYTEYKDNLQKYNYLKYYYHEHSDNNSASFLLNDICINDLMIRTPNKNLERYLNVVDSYDLFKFEAKYIEEIIDNGKSLDDNLHLIEAPLLNELFYSIFDKNDIPKSLENWYKIVCDYLEYNGSILEYIQSLEIGSYLYNKAINDLKKVLSYQIYKFAETNHKVLIVLGNNPTFFNQMAIKMSLVSKGIFDVDFIIFLNFISTDDTMFNVSLRVINQDFNVNKIAQIYFGGGGHVKASGGRIKINEFFNLININ